jgi:hypothetical protein
LGLSGRRPCSWVADTCCCCRCCCCCCLGCFLSCTSHCS